MKKSLLAISLFAVVAYAMDFAEYRAQQAQQFGSYKEKLDKEFAKMLEQDWQEFQQMYSPSTYTEPKPSEAPVVKPEPKEKEPKLEEPKQQRPFIIVPPIEKKPPKRVTPPKPEPETFTDKVKEFEFFLNNVSIVYDRKLPVAISGSDNEAIAKFWNEVSDKPLDGTLKSIQKIQDSFNLNDWGLYQLLYEFSNRLYSDGDSANMMAWYLFTRLGYDVKIAYNSSGTYLLAPVTHSVYQVNFYNLDGSRYYLLSENGRGTNPGQIFTYTGEYPDSTKQMSFFFDQALVFEDYHMISRTLSFEYGGESYSFDTEVSKALIEFYKRFPQSDYNVYFQAPNQSYLFDSLLTQLQPHIENRSEEDAVNFLLRFVQTAFEYKTDDEQFSYEKVMFPDETIYYPYSDCEDRTIMFRFLVDNLTTLQTVGVKYDGHFSTAVSFSSDVSGASFEHGGKRYVMADPTYINADVGMVMPRYKQSDFEVYN